MTRPKRFRDMGLTPADAEARASEHWWVLYGKNGPDKAVGLVSYRSFVDRAKRLLPLWRELGIEQLKQEYHDLGMRICYACPWWDEADTLPASSAAKLSECQRAVASSLHSDTAQLISARAAALHRALDLVEAQEKADGWTAFADKMPEPPVAGDKRVLLCRLIHEDWEVFTNDDYGGWLDGDGTSLARYKSCTHWRLITPPEVAGGES